MQDPHASPSQHWFVIDLVEKTFEGPLTLDDLKNNLIEGKVFWSDIAFCPAKDFSWVRLFEIRELTELCPPLPSPELLKHFRNVGFRQTRYAKLPLKLPPGTPAASPAAKPDREPAPAPRKYEREPEREIVIPAESAETRARHKTKIKTMIQQRVSEPAPAPASAQVRVPAPAPSSRSSSPSRSSSSAKPARSGAPLLGPAEWHLLIDDNEGGPFTLREIETAFRAGKKPDRAYVWKQGMKRWRPVGKVKEFKHLSVGSYGEDFAESEDDNALELELNQNKRRAFRKSFVASVLRISDSGIRQMIGVCGNITVDGLHLFQDQFRVQYPLKSRHVLEIKPLKLMKLPAFRVVAEVRWIDPDTHGIGFQFMEISEVDQKLLQRYLASVS